MCWSRADLRSPRSFICFLPPSSPFFYALAATIITSRLHPSSIALLDAPRWRRQRRLDEIFIETPADYSEAMLAQDARARKAREFARLRIHMVMQPSARYNFGETARRFSRILKFCAPKMKFGRRARADANEISRREMRWAPLSRGNGCDRKGGATRDLTFVTLRGEKFRPISWINILRFYIIISWFSQKKIINNLKNKILGTIKHVILLTVSWSL